MYFMVRNIHFSLIFVIEFLLHCFFHNSFLEKETFS